MVDLRSHLEEEGAASLATALSPNVTVSMKQCRMKQCRMKQCRLSLDGLRD